MHVCMYNILHQLHLLLHLGICFLFSTVLKRKSLDAGCLSLSSKFRLCITSTSTDISLPFDSGLHFTIVNYGSCRYMLSEDLKNHIFQVLYPGLHKYYIVAVEILQTIKCSSISHYNFLSTMSTLTPRLSSEYFQKWLQWNHYRNQVCYR